MATEGGAPLHPPAMGGKTAWGVSNVVSCSTDDPEYLQKMQKAQLEFDEREERRLQKLKDMDRNAGSILEDRQARRSGFQMGVIKGLDEHKKRQDEIFKKMMEERERKAAEKKAKKKAEQASKKKDSKKKGKKRKKDSSSDSGSDSSSDDSSSSESAPKKSKKELKAEKKAAEEAEAKAKLEEAENKRLAMIAKAQEKEAKKKAKEQLAGWKEEQKKKDAEEAARKEAEAKKRADEAEAKRKEAAKKKAEEEAAKKKAEEEEAEKKQKEKEARKALFQADGLKKVKEAKKKDDGKGALAGGFRVREHVKANFDITIRGNIVVLKDTAGTIVGPAESDPIMRIAVDFVTRQDGGVAVLNVVPREIRRG